ncbi:MAG: tyrosine-type recombinase/integrase [Streptomycetales bacterium]
MTVRRSAAHPHEGGRPLSYEVHVWKIQTYSGKRGRTYAVRWSVADSRRRKTFKTRALAESFRASLLAESRRGVAFDAASGLPVTMLPDERTRTWYEHAVAYVDMKWPRAAGKSRASIADTLATVTPALLTTDRGRPDLALIREALYQWAFNRQRRQAGPPPRDLARCIAWLERNTVPLSAFEDAAVVRAALDRLALKLDGSPAAANTVSRKRAVLYNALQYAVELQYFAAHPMSQVKWRAPKVAESINPRAVIDPKRAVALLNAVRAQGRTGRHLVAFFGCMYYSALRPGEVMRLTQACLDLPEEGTGWLHLSQSAPLTGSAWSDSGQSRDTRQLKHRAVEDVRVPPAPSPLTALLHDHLRQFGTAPAGRLFRGAQGGFVPDSVYGEIWRNARRAALDPAEYNSLLAATPYDLRHAAVSTWLNAGVAPTRIAEWAGHSVHVLLKVYAKCLIGQEDLDVRRIEAVLNAD